GAQPAARAGRRSAAAADGACRALPEAPAWSGRRSRRRSWTSTAPARARRARSGTAERPEPSCDRPWGRGLSLPNLLGGCQSGGCEGAPAWSGLQSPEAGNCEPSRLPGRQAELAGDHEPLDLARALADLQDLGIAV